MNNLEYIVGGEEDFINHLSEIWNRDYGAFKLERRSFHGTTAPPQEGGFILRLVTGGWSENEEIIKELQQTLFWSMYWQQSSRGGYYEFGK